MDIKHDIKDIRMTSSELAYLWATYLMESKCKYVTSCVNAHIDDQDMHQVMQLAVDLSDKHRNEIQSIFKTISAPVPYGFTEKDINKGATKLFSNVLNLVILKGYTVFGFYNYGMALSMAARSDVKQFFTECLTSSIDLSNKIDEILLNKGIFIRTPYVEIPNKVEFVHNQSILGHFIGHNRPLNFFEITHVHSTSRAMCVTEALLTALSQIVGDKRLQKFLEKGKMIAKEHIETLNSILIKENLTIPPSLITEVLNSTQAPFSDRLSCFFAMTIIEDMLINYSTAILKTMRKDVIASLTTLSIELNLYIKNGMDIMLDNAWYEKVPENI